MSSLVSLLAAQTMVLTNNTEQELFYGVHIPIKDAPPPQAIQNELMAKAIAKRERKQAKRIKNNYLN